MTATITQVVKECQQDGTNQIAPEAIWTACRDAAYQWRERTLHPVTPIQLFLGQIRPGNTACTHLRHLPKRQGTASAYCQARMKLPLPVFQQLLRSVSHALQHASLAEGRWCGPRTFWVDGSSCSMPDTPVLQAHFGQSSTHLPGCGFPIAHLLALLHAGPGMVLQLLAAPLCTHALSEGASLHPALRPGDVLVADRGFCSYAHLALLIQAGGQAVFRIHQTHSVDFTPGRAHVELRKRGKRPKGQPRSRWVQQLGEHDQRVQWCKPLSRPQRMPAEQFALLPARLDVRALRYQVPRKGFRVRTIPLVPTLLDAVCYPGEALAQLYGARGGIETHCAHLQTPLGLDVLKCKTVDGVLKDLIVFA